MIVSRKHGFVFVKTIKTAGTSIEVALSGCLGPDDVFTGVDGDSEEFRSVTPTAAELPSHTSASEIARLFPDEWDRSFKFSVVRNPFDRAVSAAFFNTKPESPDDVERWFIQKARRKMLPLLSVDGRMAMDYVMRYETLGEDFAYVSDHLRLGVSLPEHRMKGGYRPKSASYRDWVTPRLRAVISASCAAEMRMFGYEW